MVDRLLSDATLGDHLGRRGEAYARRQFSWPVVLDRYAALADRIAAAVPAAGPEGARRAPL